MADLLTYRPDVILPDLYYLPTPNQSSRMGSKIDGIVLHETEGSFLGAVSWLRRPAPRFPGDTGSSATGVLSEDGTKFAQLVPYNRKAWHASAANRYTLGLELAGKTSEVNDLDQLVVAARICAFWCHTFGIPPKQADSRGHAGLAMHKQLGAYGGGHHDPGGFDWPTFLKRVAIEVKRGGFRPKWGVT